MELYIYKNIEKQKKVDCRKSGENAKTIKPAIPMASSGMKKFSRFPWGREDSLNVRLLSSFNRLFSLPKSETEGLDASDLPERSTSGESDEHLQDTGSPKTWILDPDSDTVLIWNKVFLCASLVALFIDPLYFFLPMMVEKANEFPCADIDLSLRNPITCIRAVAEVFYWIHMYIKFRTGYLLPTSCITGRGQLVVELNKVAMRYLKSSFLVNLVATLPLPQMVIWTITRDPESNHRSKALALVVLLQYLPRLYIIFHLIHRIIRASGVVTKTIWAGASYILLLYLLISHVIGAAWYLLALDRYMTCLKSICKLEIAPFRCVPKYLDCTTKHHVARIAWADSTRVFVSCDPGNDIEFQYGIFEYAVAKNVLSSDFAVKYFYGLWFGVQNLSSFGRNLATSAFIGETTFSILIGLTGIILFARLVGDIQTFLKSSTERCEQWRVRRRETEEWMEDRRFPEDIRERVRHYIEYKWLATRGVNEEYIRRSLPADILRDIQRHLCLDLVRRVPLFAQMDDQLLDAICDRLVSSLITKGAYRVREGDPVTEMLFIIRGNLETSNSNDHQAGILCPGDFCGEELLEWALHSDSNSSPTLPSSTRTVRAILEVEAFALRAEDLRQVAKQFKKFSRRKLKHIFRFYSHSWRTWAASFIQAAWRRSKRKKERKSLSEMQPFTSSKSTKIEQEGVRTDEVFWLGSSSSYPKMDMGDAVLAIAANPRKGIHSVKPEEPDFSTEI